MLLWAKFRLLLAEWCYNWRYSKVRMGWGTNLNAESLNILNDRYLKTHPYPILEDYISGGKNEA